VRRVLPLDDLPPLPDGRYVDLPAGRTWVTEVAGPPGAPTLVLLHALGCTGMVTWLPAVAALSEHFRLVVPDLRWHGRGPHTGDFSLADCADDVADLVEVLDLGPVVVCGYSLGSMVAQRVWRQHPEVVAGLVLGATTDRLRGSVAERVVHTALAVTVAPLSGLSRTSAAKAAARQTDRVLTDEQSDVYRWAIADLRSISPLAVAGATARLGPHHSAPWLHRIDVPTAVIVTLHDRVIPPARQRAVASAIPGATVHEASTGHAATGLQRHVFVPVLVQACLDVTGRVSARRS
jgi:3-oxoadipate enol-lactonase